MIAHLLGAANTSPTKAKIMSKPIAIRNWKPLQKNTLRGFFTIELPSGMIIHEVMLHEKGHSRWIQFSAREYADKEGQKQYRRFIDFSDRSVADHFRDLVLAALDQHFANQIDHAEAAK